MECVVAKERHGELFFLEMAEVQEGLGRPALHDDEHHRHNEEQTVHRLVVLQGLSTYKTFVAFMYVQA